MFTAWLPEAHLISLVSALCLKLTSQRGKTASFRGRPEGQAGGPNVIPHPCTRPRDIISVRRMNLGKSGEKTAVKHKMLREKERKNVAQVGGS